MRNADDKKDFIRRSVLLAIICLCFCCFSETVYALSFSSFSLEKDNGLGKEYFDERNIQTHTTPYRGGAAITGVDIADDGMFLLVFNSTRERSEDDSISPDQVEVHSSDGTFLYRISIDEAGTTNAFFDQKSNTVVLYIVRQNLLLNLDTQGHYLASYLINRTDQSLTSIREMELYDSSDSFSKTINGNIYTMQKHVRRNGSLGRTDSFAVTSQDGEVLYQYSSKNGLNNTACILSLLLCTFVCIWLISCRRKHRNMHKNDKLFFI